MKAPFREDRFAPGKLWSLLDVFKFHGKNFVEAMVWLNKLKEMPSDSLVTNQEFVVRLLNNLSIEIMNLHLPMSETLVNRTILQIPDLLSPEAHPDIVRRMFGQKVDEISSRIEDEISNSVIYCLSPTEAIFALATQPPFGDDVRDKFAGASSDLEEARKCMAFGRWTAAVFHLMRALEFALTCLGKKLNATVVNGHGGPLTWGVIISNIDGKIEKLARGDERNRLSQARALLSHVNSAWRTETMHPKATYTEEEARSAYDASGSFLRHLASLV